MFTDMEIMTNSIPSFLLVLALTQSAFGWFNQYDQEFTFTCPAQQFLSRIKSIHNNHNEDRVFDFECSPFPLRINDTCFLSGFANDYDQPEVFQCPYGGYIAGLYSIHNNHNEDRRFKFRCCEVKGVCMKNCQYSGFANHYDGELDYTVPKGYILRGIESVHNNHYEDRIFNFEVCQAQEC